MTPRTQKNVLKWAHDSFGDTALNQVERAARLVEEAIELAQTLGLSQDQLSAISNRVYERPPGELWQEIGGTMITLQGLAENAGLMVDDCANREWRRVLSKSPDWWEAKHAEKVAAGTADLPLSTKRNEP